MLPRYLTQLLLLWFDDIKKLWVQIRTGSTTNWIAISDCYLYVEYTMVFFSVQKPSPGAENSFVSTLLWNHPLWAWGARRPTVARHG